MRSWLAALVLAGLGAAALAAGPSFDFVPDGGRGLFAEAFPDPGAARAALATNRTLDEWSAAIAAAAPDLDAKAARTLAGYLAANAPLDALADAQDLAGALPPDGKDLALARCQSCHGLFSGYLMHRRDVDGWRGVFKSPFHVGIAMTPAELATFADYSAVNMPLRVQDVPPELRF